MREDEQALYDQIERLLGRPFAAAPTISDAATAVLARHRIVRFRGNAMVKAQIPYERFAPIDKGAFEQIAYPLVGGMPVSRMNDAFAYTRSVASDITAYDRYILFGTGSTRQFVWDMERLEVRTDISLDNCVWRSPFTPTSVAKPIKFILDLAGGNIGKYDDIMQSLAPLVMTTKPVGVIWWVGGNVDGKRALFNALDKIFPDQITDLTVKQLNGGRSNTPLLNGVLGNVAEDENSQIANTQIYKSIGTHEDFFMHRWRSQRGITIRGNVHHVFAADHAPKFYTKNLSIDRRTHTIPFSQAGSADAQLTNGFYGQLLAEMCRYAVIIKQQGYRYEWSGVVSA